MGLTGWTIVIGAASAAACSLVGCYLVLRRLSLLGDAISHAVLPGLVAAFLVTGRLGGVPAVVGALAVGVLTSVLADLVHRRTGVPEDAGLGVVFTSLFALGVVLLGLAGGADLDPGCVLYGLIELAPIDRVPLFGVEVPRTLLTLGPVLLLTGALLGLFWKEVQLTAFDPAHATASGMPAGLVHHGMLALTAGVVVASFEAVGSILVVAMLIVPPVTAGLVTRRLHHMIAVAVLFAVTAAAGGTVLATWWNTSVAGMMAVVAGAQLAAVLAASRLSA
jgi:manganese/zinc/iron transport system permease protein